MHCGHSTNHNVKESDPRADSIGDLWAVLYGTAAPTGLCREWRVVTG